jgi:hypothetical protein
VDICLLATWPAEERGVAHRRSCYFRFSNTARNEAPPSEVGENFRRANEGSKKLDLKWGAQLNWYYSMCPSINFI